MVQSLPGVRAVLGAGPGTEWGAHRGQGIAAATAPPLCFVLAQVLSTRSVLDRFDVAAFQTVFLTIFVTIRRAVAAVPLSRSLGLMSTVGFQDRFGAGLSSDIVGYLFSLVSYFASAALLVFAIWAVAFSLFRNAIKVLRDPSLPQARARPIFCSSSLTSSKWPRILRYIGLTSSWGVS